jgi:hypothetical protein
MEYRQLEDILEIDRLNKEGSKLAVENNKLKEKMGRKKNKIQNLKEEIGRLKKVLAQFGVCDPLPPPDDYDMMGRMGYIVEADDYETEAEKRELKENQKRKLIETAKHDAERQIRISEEDPSIPYDDNNERIIFRNGKIYKQWFQHWFGSHIWYAEKEITRLDEEQRLDEEEKEEED